MKIVNIEALKSFKEKLDDRFVLKTNLPIVFTDSIYISDSENIDLSDNSDKFRLMKNEKGIYVLLFPNEGDFSSVEFIEQGEAANTVKACIINLGDRWFKYIGGNKFVDMFNDPVYSQYL